MSQDIFNAGVSPGSPTTQSEIKMLLCYILSQVDSPMRFDQIHEALMENGLVNYFELVRTLEKLVRTQHIRVERAQGEADRYEATALGRDAAGEFVNVLPRSVREKALEASQKRLKRDKRASEVIVQVRKIESGFMLDLSIPDNSETLISFSLFAPTQKQCEQIRRSFLNSPQFIYKAVMALLTGDEQVIGPLFPREEKLF